MDAVWNKNEFKVKGFKMTRIKDVKQLKELASEDGGAKIMKMKTVFKLRNDRNQLAGAVIGSPSVIALNALVRRLFRNGWTMWERPTGNIFFKAGRHSRYVRLIWEID